MVINRTKQLILFAFCLIVLFGMETISANAAACGSNQICLYDGAGFSGEQLNIDATNPAYQNTYIYLYANYSGVAFDFSNKLTSFTNNSPFAVTLGAGSELGTLNVAPNDTIDLSNSSLNNKVYYLYIANNGVTVPTSTPVPTTAPATPTTPPSSNNCSNNTLCLYDGAGFSGEQLNIDATNPAYQNTYIYLYANYSGVAFDFSNKLTSFTNNSPFVVTLGAGSGLGRATVAPYETVDMSGTSRDNKVYYLYIENNGVTVPTSTPIPTTAPATPTSPPPSNNCNNNMLCLYDGAGFSGEQLNIDATNPAYQNTYIYLYANYSGVAFDFSNKLTSFTNNSPFVVTLGAGSGLGRLDVAPYDTIDMSGTSRDNQVYYLYIENNGATVPTNTPAATSVSPTSVPPTPQPTVSSTADTDGDGLLDTWEVNGYDANNDGIVDVNLPAMGADPNRKDIFVEIDFMVGTRNHKPISQGIRDIVTSFANAPVSNPDGSTGIRLHVDYGPDAPLTYGRGSTWGSLGRGNALSYSTHLTDCPNNFFPWGSFDTIKNTNFRSERRPIFHYNLWVHHLCPQYGTISGISRNAGGSAFTNGASDFIVSLGGWANDVGSQNQQAGTFMHELGHNLGLMHGGTNHQNWKPNYLSVMNYGFQTAGLRKSGSIVFDYSRYSLSALNESRLNEGVGLGVASNFEVTQTIHRCPDNRQLVAAPNAIDWNCNGSTGGVVQVDANGSNSFDVLTTHNDWLNMTFSGGLVGDAGSSARSRSQLPLESSFQELTYEEAQKIMKAWGGKLVEPTSISLSVNHSQTQQATSELILVLVSAFVLTGIVCYRKYA